MTNSEVEHRLAGGGLSGRAPGRQPAPRPRAARSEAAGGELPTAPRLFGPFPVEVAVRPAGQTAWAADAVRAWEGARPDGSNVLRTPSADDLARLHTLTDADLDADGRSARVWRLARA